MRRAACSALLVAVALASSAAAASAQIASDSVEVDIYAAGDIVVTIAPRTFTGLVGDTVTFTAVAIDAPTGDTISVLLNWSTPTPQAVSIDPMTGHATFLSRGRWRIRVDVERIGGVVLYELRPSGFVVPVPEDGIRMAVGEEKQLCAYLTNTWGVPIAKSAELCPLPLVSPAWAPIMPGLLERAGIRAG